MKFLRVFFFYFQLRLEERNRTEADQVVVFPVVVRRKREPAVVARSCGDGDGAMLPSANPFLNPFIYGLESNQVESLAYLSPPAIGYAGVRNEHIELPPAVDSFEGNIPHIEQNSQQIFSPISHIEQNSEQILFPGEIPPAAESVEENIPCVERNAQQILSPGYVDGTIDPVESRQSLSTLNVSTNPFLRGPMEFNFCGSTPVIPKNPEPMTNESIQESEFTVIERSNEFVYVDTPRRFLQGRTLQRTPPGRHSYRDRREPDRLSYQGGINAIIKVNKFCLSLINKEWNEWMIHNGVEWMYLIIEMNEWIWVILNYKRCSNWRLFFEVMNNIIILWLAIFFQFFFWLNCFLNVVFFSEMLI